MAVTPGTRVDANFGLTGTSWTSVSNTWTSGTLYVVHLFEYASGGNCPLPSSVAGATMTFARATSCDLNANFGGNTLAGRLSVWVAIGNGNTETVTATYGAITDGFGSIMPYTGAKTTNGGLDAIRQAVTLTTPSNTPSISLAALQDAGSLAVGLFYVTPQGSTGFGTGFTGIGGYGHASPLACDGVDEFKANTTTVNATATSPTNLLAVGYEIAAPAAGSAPSGGTETITGTQKVGSTLTCTSTTWTGTPTSYSYTWQRADDAGFTTNVVSIQTDTLAGTTDTYTVAPADDTKYLRCQVVATNGSGSSSPVNSAVTAQVTYAAPVNTSAPVIAGIVSVGQPLSVVTEGTYDPA